LKPSRLMCATIVFFASFKIINKKLANSKIVKIAGKIWQIYPNVTDTPP
jgi:hypothetical protein